MLAQLAPLLAVVLLAVLLGAVLVAAAPPDRQEALADINHSIHIGSGLACVDCHTGVESHSRAGVPSIEICAGCHEGSSAEDLGGTANAVLIAAHLESGEEPWWPRRYILADHLIFSHLRHFKVAGIDCSECHGDMSSATTLPAEPIGRVLTMEGCMECHRRHGATLDCWACHR